MTNATNQLDKACSEHGDTVQITAWVPRQMRDDFSRIAWRNERTFSHEIQRAMSDRILEMDR